MSKIKAFSFFIIILVILVATSYFLNTKKTTPNEVSDFSEKNIELNQEEDNDVLTILAEDGTTEVELSDSEDQTNKGGSLNALLEDQIIEDLIDDTLVADGSQDPITLEIEYLDKATEIAKNYVLNNQKYIDDKGFGLTIMNVTANNCQDCWSTELNYETIGKPVLLSGPDDWVTQHYFKNIIISLKNEKIIEVIWEGQILDINN
jgi:hypothetical protein